ACRAGLGRQGVGRSGAPPLARAGGRSRALREIPRHALEPVGRDRAGPDRSSFAAARSAPLAGGGGPRGRRRLLAESRPRRLRRRPLKKTHRNLLTAGRSPLSLESGDERAARPTSE